MHRETPRRLEVSKRLLVSILAALACAAEITTPESEAAQGGTVPVHVSDAAVNEGAAGGVGGTAGQNGNTAGTSNAGAGGTDRGDPLDAGSVGGRPSGGAGGTQN